MIYCKPMWCSLLFDHCYAESNAELWQLQSSVGNEERRREGMKGAKETVSGNKVNSSWFREAVTVNLFTLHVESFAHLDNTVNSNQDQAYQIIDPEWKEDGVEVACDEVTHASNNLFTTFILIAEISYLSACFITEMCTAEHRSSPATTHPTTGNKWHTKSQLMPLTLCYTAQAQRYMCSIPL